MENRKSPLPGSEDFASIVRSGCFVDKTPLIREITQHGMTTLIPRPRRFGKTLNLDMIRCFLQVGADPSLFQGLEISGDAAFCRENMGKYPILYFNFKGITGKTFGKCCSLLTGQLYLLMTQKYSFLKTSGALEEEDRAHCRLFMQGIAGCGTWTDGEGNSVRSLPPETLEISLQALSVYLRKHFGRKAAVLIDEYDTPLVWARIHGFYPEMAGLMGAMLGNLLRGNGENVDFAVLTGCLPIAEDSMFRGMDGILVRDPGPDFSRDFFGFTRSETEVLLDRCGLPDAAEPVLRQYCGFRFGHEQVCSPWDVILYIRSRISGHPADEPAPYWADSSGNGILSWLLSRSEASLQRDYDILMAGGTAVRPVLEAVPLQQLDSPDMLWSLLAASGYLTVCGRSGCEAELAVPNLEIRDLFGQMLIRHVSGRYHVDERMQGAFCSAVAEGSAAAVQETLTVLLDTLFRSRDGDREALYHGIILGLLCCRWKRNAGMESGEGFWEAGFLTSDCTGAVLAVRYGENSLEESSREALAQSRCGAHAAALFRMGARKIRRYGIACRRGSVSVMMDTVCTGQALPSV